MLTQDKFVGLTKVVIDNLEGGYYHPDMLSLFNVRSQAVLKASGETMFGLDRKHGIQLAKYPEWNLFWAAIDKNRHNFPTRWKHEYRGGEIESELKMLASVIMYKWFQYLAKKYILVGSLDEIENDERLIIHFSYASWNGEGWFKKYATALNNAILKYTNNKEMIFNEAFKERLYATNKWGIPNKTIRQQGQNMMNLFRRLKLV
jgi:hypothetical protein